MLVANQIVFWVDDSNGRTERILWISEDQAQVYCLDITKKSGMPIFRKVSDLLDDINRGKAVILDDDPWIKNISEIELSDTQEKKRNRAWGFVSRLISNDNLPAIFNKEQRGKIMSKIAEESNVKVLYLYRQLFRYWQRGMSKNALIPDYELSGGKGKQRRAGEKKRGRPKKSALSTEGINITEAVRGVICRAIKEFYFQPEKRTLRQVYQLMLQKYFSEDIQVADDSLKVYLVEEGQRPSYDQFYQVYRKEFDCIEALKKRNSEKEFMRKHRAILGDSTAEASGPGEKYQFDATIADVYLVSRLKRERIIGRPVIYGVIDVFSRMIVGVYVGLEGPSWLGAMMALANIVQDKTKYCSEYGFAIAEEQWPCRYMPSAFLGDRGELLQANFDSLLSTLRIRGENAPAYRGDLKGIVERFFRTVQDEFRPNVPGAVQRDFQERGAKDYRLNAKLDLHQFTKIILAIVVEHNNKKVLTRYVRDRQMIEDEVKPIPIELWNWGVKNRSGALRWVEETVVKLNLLPKDTALITARGILFQKMHYSCETALKERWFEKARQKGNWKIEVSYDPRLVNPIYIRNEDGRTYEVCRLVERDVRFDGMSLFEVDDLFRYEGEIARELKNEEVSSGVNVLALIEQVVKEATEETELAKKPAGTTKKERIKNIRSNRKEEREIIRQKEAFVLEDALRPSIEKTEVKPEPDKKEAGNVPSHLISYLLKQQKERGDS